MEDQRNEPRDRLVIPVTLAVEGIGVQSATTVDVGHLSVRLRTASDVPVGSRVRIEMRLPSRLLQGWGRVVRSGDQLRPSRSGEYVCAVRLDEPLRPAA